ncbi:MAG: VanW family protein [Bacillota bacterium]|nr:VanW family protein [Bacillota bacterium]MDW7684627.1 VanW family protein [Bacillota bacterium]
MTSNKKNIPRWLLIAAWVTAVALLFVTADYGYHSNRIYSGVYIDELDVGKKTKEEALNLLAEAMEKEDLAWKKVRFAYDNNTWELPFSQIGAAPDLEGTIEEAFQTGREKIHLFRYPKRITLARSKTSVTPLMVTDMVSFRAAMENIAADVLKEPENAVFILSEDKKSVDIIPDMPGREMDFAATYDSLQSSLAGYPNLDTVTVSVREVEAQWTAQDLESLNVREEVSSYSTALSGSNANRMENIRLAAGALDETLILPGGEFSFNESVGDTTAEQGYKPAPVILSGEIAEGVGGGVCQVSSTLYNAVLLADIAITQRRNHSLRVAYLPPGLDATVAYGVIDLKFHNDRSHAIWMRTFIERGKLTVSLYGSPIPGQEVKVVTQNVTKIPPGEKVTKTAELPMGVREKIKEGQPGYRVTVWRITTLNGEEIKREKISEDTYKAVPAEFRVGTAEIPASTDSGEEQENENGPEGEQENREGEANQ